MNVTKPPRPTVAQRLDAGQIDGQQALELTREAALRTLDRAAKSQADLAVSLLRRGYPEHLVDSVLDRLTSVGILDDAAYAMAIVRSRQAERGLAKSALARELARRGIPNELAETALGQVTGATEDETMQALIVKSLNRTSELEYAKRVRRTIGVLGRKGYEPEKVYPAVFAALAAEEAREPNSG